MSKPSLGYSSSFTEPGDGLDDEMDADPAFDAALALFRSAGVTDEDPALTQIALAVRELERFGFDIHDPEILQRAIDKGRRDYEDRYGSMDVAARRVQLERGLPPVTRGEVVYYMRIGNRIKIGTSGNLDGRMATINPEQLMAVEPGGYELETQRHKQFAASRVHGEWFRMDTALMAHVEALRSSARVEVNRYWDEFAANTKSA